MIVAKSAKKLAFAAILAIAAMATTPAVAKSLSVSGPHFSLEIGSGHYYDRHSPYRHYGHRPHHRHYGHRPHHRRHHYRDRYYRRNICSPGEAVYKAGRLGMRHANVRRVRSDAIVVTGWHRGHRARLVFDRYSRYCRILASRGI